MTTEPTSASVSSSSQRHLRSTALPRSTSSPAGSPVSSLDPFERLHAQSAELRASADKFDRGIAALRFNRARLVSARDEALKLVQTAEGIISEGTTAMPCPPGSYLSPGEFQPAEFRRARFEKAKTDLPFLKDQLETAEKDVQQMEMDPLKAAAAADADREAFRKHLENGAYYGSSPIPASLN